MTIGLSEKYRPERLKEVIGNTEITTQLQTIINKKEAMPTMIFLGPPGSGKTTVARCVARERYGEDYQQFYTEIDASVDRGIDLVRGRLKSLSQTYGSRIVCLDESDNMCLTTGTKVVVGRKDGWRGFRLKDIDKVGMLYRNGNYSWVEMPSVNLETGQVEDDHGKRIDSGETDFYRITFEDERVVEASINHPFFEWTKDGLLEKKVSELKVGSVLADYSYLLTRCEICDKPISYDQRFCSKDCASKGHSKDMSGSGNPNYESKITSNPEVRKKMSKSISLAYAEGRLVNPSTLPHVKELRRQHKLDHPEETKKFSEAGKKRGESIKGKTYEEIYSPEEAKLYRLLVSSQYRKTGKMLGNYRQVFPELDTEKELPCEICKKITKIHEEQKHINSVIHVHHINGDKSDNRRENLMLICGGCHLELHKSAQKAFLAFKKEDYRNFLTNWTILMKEQGFVAEPVRRVLTNGAVIKSIEYIGKQKAWNITMQKNKNFILGNGILTHNTSDAQFALRGVLQDSVSTTFILTGNYKDRFIDPLVSRCVPFTFRPLTAPQIFDRLNFICQAEGITVSFETQEQADTILEGLTYLSTTANGNLRNAINILEKLVNENKNISIEEIALLSRPKPAIEMLTMALRGNFWRAKSMLEDMLVKDGVAPLDIIYELFDSIPALNIDGLSDDVKIRLFKRLGEIEGRLNKGNRGYVQLTTLLASAWIYPHLSTIPREEDV